MANIVTLPVTYSDGMVLTASSLSQNFNALNTATIPVANGGTGLAAGTSGGIPYFSATTTIGSSGVLTANRIVLGGGAGAAPTILGSLGTSTTVLHGNASGPPSFGAVVLTTDVSGVLPIANGGVGTTPTAGVVTRTAGDVTTTNTTDTALTGASITITTLARRVLLGLTANGNNNSANNALRIKFQADGSDVTTSLGVHQTVASAAYSNNLSNSVLTAVQTAASHTYTVVWSVDATTGTIYGVSSTGYHFYATEQMATA